MNMKEKLKKILKYREYFLYNECTVNSLIIIIEKRFQMEL